MSSAHAVSSARAAVVLLNQATPDAILSRRPLKAETLACPLHSSEYRVARNCQNAVAVDAAPIRSRPLWTARLG